MPQWFMDALINECLVEDSKNMTPDNSVLKAKPQFISSKKSLTKILLAHEEVSK